MKIRFNYLKIFTQDYVLGKVISVIVSLCEMLILLIFKPSKRLLRVFGFIFKIKPWYSMLSTVRLLNLYELVSEAQRGGLEGDIVECGVWNGGAAAMMARSNQDNGGKNVKSIWLFDSFEGLPPPGDRDGKVEVECYFKGLCKGSLENVKAIFNKLGVPFDHVKVVKGWLENTLQANTVGQVILLHIDTDWYKSVKAPLEHIYDKVVVGGYIVVDDFYLHQGCRNAVLDFLKERGLDGRVQIIKVDHSAIYFKKI